MSTTAAAAPAAAAQQLRTLEVRFFRAADAVRAARCASPRRTRAAPPPLLLPSLDS